MVRMSHRLRIEHGTRLTDEFTSRISLLISLMAQLKMIKVKSSSLPRSRFTFG